MDESKKNLKNDPQESVTQKRTIPGVYQTPTRYIPNDVSEEICKKLHEERFSVLYKTEGTRHGNGLIPINIHDFFDEPPQSW